MIQGILQAASHPQFNRASYLSEIKQAQALKDPIYTYETTSKAKRIAWTVFSAVIFPVGLYRLLQKWAGYVILGSSSSSKKKFAAEIRDCYANALGQNPQHSPDAVFKRISILVNGSKVDAYVIGRKSNLLNGKWCLYSGGNEELAETKLLHTHQVMDSLNYNMLYFNYAGVGASEGWATPDNVINSQKAMLRFLEDREKGIGAEKIVPWGLSMGGGVQGEALNSHPLAKDVQYTFVKEQTFAKLHKVPAGLFGKVLGKIAEIAMRLLGWTFSGVRSMEAIKDHKEIIIHKGTEKFLTQRSEIQDDQVISAQASYAWKVLKDPGKYPNKVVIGMERSHGASLTNAERERVSKVIRAAMGE